MKRKVMPNLGRTKYYRAQFDFKKRWLATVGKCGLSQHMLSSKHMIGASIGDNNHLLTSGLIYYVVLHAKVPYIKIDDIHYELKLGSEIGLDIDGDTIMIVTMNDTLYATRVTPIKTPGLLSTITVGNPLQSQYTDEFANWVTNALSTDSDYYDNDIEALWGDTAEQTGKTVYELDAEWRSQFEIGPAKPSATCDEDALYRIGYIGLYKKELNVR